MIVEYYKDHFYSLSTIRYWAQKNTQFNERPCTGINPTETLAALTHFGVHYRIATNIDAHFVRKKLEIGPVLVGVGYRSYPNNANGHCGTSNKAHLNGKTDCAFKGSHAVVAVKRRWHVTNRITRKGHTDFYVRDPDHNSYSRPEKPKYDLISISQLQAAMVALPRDTEWGVTYCMYPLYKKKL